MAPIIGLSVVIVLSCLLFPGEVARRDLSPLVVFLLVITLIMLTQHGGRTVELGPALWGSYWLPQMLLMIILFLLWALPGPKLLTLLKDRGSKSYRALATTAIGLLVCVLIGVIAMTVASRVDFW